jgi:hypothetical protein
MIAGRRERPPAQGHAAVPRPALKVADILRDHGTALRRANARHVSLDQVKVVSAIERCGTVAPGGHVARYEDCADTVITCISCRNRHCPSVRAPSARKQLAEREADCGPSPTSTCSTLPGPIADISATITKSRDLRSAAHGGGG